MFGSGNCSSSLLLYGKNQAESLTAGAVSPVVHHDPAFRVGIHTCWDSKIVPLSYSHNTGVNGPEEFKLLVQHSS